MKTSSKSKPECKPKSFFFSDKLFLNLKRCHYRTSIDLSASEFIWAAYLNKQRMLTKFSSGTRFIYYWSSFKIPLKGVCSWNILPEELILTRWLVHQISFCQNWKAEIISFCSTTDGSPYSTLSDVWSHQFYFWTFFHLKLSFSGAWSINRNLIEWK